MLPRLTVLPDTGSVIATGPGAVVTELMVPIDVTAVIVTASPGVKNSEAEGEATVYSYSPLPAAVSVNVYPPMVTVAPDIGGPHSLPTLR
jgi:hypothetical protein